MEHVKKKKFSNSIDIIIDNTQIENVVLFTNW